MSAWSRLMPTIGALTFPQGQWGAVEGSGQKKDLGRLSHKGSGEPSKVLGRGKTWEDFPTIWHQDLHLRPHPLNNSRGGVTQVDSNTRSTGTVLHGRPVCNPWRLTSLDYFFFKHKYINEYLDNIILSFSLKTKHIIVEYMLRF